MSKSFPGVQALQDVDFSLRQGEVHALVGENGAGKSTLIKILAGVYKYDSGQIFLDGNQIAIEKPADSIKMGISIIHQEFNLVPTSNVAENLYLGMEPRKRYRSFVDKKQMHIGAKKVLASLKKQNIDTYTMIRDLTVAQQQTIEIAKAIHRKSKIVIMDEPTAVLTSEETRLLMSIINGLKQEGVSIIYISHRLDEIFEICDRVTVLRDGKLVETLDLYDKQVDKDLLIKLMVGREVGELYDNAPRKISNEIVLRVNNFSKEKQFQRINFSLHKGEILGVFGLVGAGRTEIMNAIFGLEKADSGYVELLGKKVNIKSPENASRMGFGYVPEDRKRKGIVGVLNLRDNISLCIPKKVSFAGFINKSRKSEVCAEYMRNLNINPKDPDRQLRFFSGGNQQKVVLSKWLANGPRILILDEPTRGIDVGTKKEIYNIIRNLAESGMSILFISSEMEEVIGVCDRLLIIHEGRIINEVLKGQASQEEILKMASNEFKNFGGLS